MKKIGVISFLLTFLAGFTDTTTFVAADKLLSAHVTGNFIIFAYDLLKGADRSAYVKLLTFPVFAAAVMLATRLDGRGGKPGRLLRLEGILLLVAALLMLVRQVTGVELCVKMIIVAAMGIQNTFGRLYPSVTYSATTVMTGNVTVASIDFVKGIRARPRDRPKLRESRHILEMMGVFLVGCLCGGLLAGRYGLIVVAVPGVLALVVAGLVKKA